MHLRTVLQHTVIIFCLLVTLGGLSYTVFRIRLPLPQIFWLYSHSTMAPFQGNSPRTFDVVAEGLKEDGTWEVIDMQHYIPLSRGWRSVRVALLEIPPAEKDEAYDDMALLLLDRERTAGRMYEEVRLTKEYWYASPYGYEAMRKDPYIERREVGNASLASMRP